MSKTGCNYPGIKAKIAEILKRKNIRVYKNKGGLILCGAIEAINILGKAGPYIDVLQEHSPLPFIVDLPKATADSAKWEWGATQYLVLAPDDLEKLELFEVMKPMVLVDPVKPQAAFTEVKSNLPSLSGYVALKLLDIHRQWTFRAKIEVIYE